MLKKNGVGLLLVLLLGLFYVGTMGCDTDPAPEECLQAIQCEDYAWRASNECTPEQGHWECMGRKCVGVCPECEENGDCGGDWDGPCDEIDGAWECRDGECQAVCAGAECVAPDDCATNPWPTDAGCLEADGSWACNNQQCETVCNANACNATGDCSGATWGIACAGHWACLSNNCTRVCDYTNCGDGVCDTAAGEDEESCMPDCGEGCASPADCLAEPWVVDICMNPSWTCDFLSGGVCEQQCPSAHCGNDKCEPELGEEEHCADCSGQGCTEDADCASLDLPVGCSGGYWTCAWVVCMAICE